MHNRYPFFQQMWLRCLLVWGIWTVVGLVDAGQSYFLHATTGTPVPLWTCLLLGVSDWYVWAAFTPLIVWMARRWPLAPGAWGFPLFFHLAASLLTSLVVIAVMVPIMETIPYALRKPTEWGELFHLLFAHKLVFYVLIHWMILMVSHGLFYYRKYKAEELQTSQLETKLAQTQLQMLRMQVQPHFLFNTLHAISALLHQDVELADRLLASLGELLRKTLRTPGVQEVPLCQELGFLHSYLEIEQARLGPRLSVQLDIDPETMEAQVPTFLLQPLVENAIRHGIAPRSAPGKVEILSRRENNHLHLEVRDNGKGLPPGPIPPWKEGVGLANTRARLYHLYGSEHHFEMSNAPDSGVVIKMTMPFRKEAKRPGQNGTVHHDHPNSDCG
jgi:hypothetical protein